MKILQLLGGMDCKISDMKMTRYCVTILNGCLGDIVMYCRMQDWTTV